METASAPLHPGNLTARDLVPRRAKREGPSVSTLPVRLEIPGNGSASLLECLLKEWAHPSWTLGWKRAVEGRVRSPGKWLGPTVWQLPAPWLPCLFG